MQYIVVELKLRDLHTIEQWTVGLGGGLHSQECCCSLNCALYSSALQLIRKWLIVKKITRDHVYSECICSLWGLILTETVHCFKLGQTASLCE